MGVQDGVSAREARLLIERQRLLDVFDELNRGIRVVGIWAPAGSGKTALLQQWIATTDGEVTFVDAAAENLVIDAIAHVRSATTVPVHLVIDRMESATSRVRDAVASLIDEGRPGVRIVLAGRFDPLPASPGRWVVSQEIRGADLAFTADEAARFFAADSTGMTSVQLERILTRTGGWPAALVLLRHLLDGRDDDAVIDRFDGDSRSVAEYLVSELLATLSARDREVLIWSAVGRHVPVGLAAALTGHSAAGTVLDELARTNSLISREGDTYVFHPILATFLGAEQRRRDIARASNAHVRAGEWFAERGDLHEAIDQLAMADDSSTLADFIEQHGYDLVFSGESGALMRAVRHLSVPDRERHEARIRLLLDIPHFTDRAGVADRIHVRRADRPDAPRHPVDEIVEALWEHANGRADGGSRLRDAALEEAAGQSTGSALLLEYAREWTSEVADDDDRLRLSQRLVEIGARAEPLGQFRWLRLLALESALSVIATASVWVDVESVFLAIGRALSTDADIGDSVSARAVFGQAAESFHRAEPLPRATLQRLGSASSSSVEPAMQHMARTIVALDDLDRLPGRLPRSPG